MIWLFILVIVGILVYGLWIEPRWFVLTRHTLQVGKYLPRPLKILHISDTHFHPCNTHIDNFFDRLSQIEDIDLVLISGDIIDSDNGIVLAVEQLKRLKPKLGMFAVFGNHDHYWYGFRELLSHFMSHISPRFPNNIALLRSSLEAIHCNVLRNECRNVAFEDTELFIAGLDDPVTEKDSSEKIENPPNGHHLRILISHLLDTLHSKMSHYEFDLAFSGHTHGGQMRLPFLGPLVTNSLMDRKYVSGLHWLGKTRVFTSRGMGTSPILPSRFFCHPEAGLFTIIGTQNFKGGN